MLQLLVLSSCEQQACCLSQCNGLSSLFKWNVCAQRAIHIACGSWNISQICTAPCIYCFKCTDSDSNIKHKKNIWFLPLMFWMHRQWFKYSTFIGILIIPSVAVKCTESDFTHNNITKVIDDVKLLVFHWKAYTTVQIIVLALQISSGGEEAMHRVTHIYHTKHILECSPYRGGGRNALLNAFTLI